MIETSRPISGKQAQFLQSEKRLVIYRAGIRSGKTWVLCLKALEFAFNKRRFCIVSFSYPILRDVCIYTMSKILNLVGYPFIENIGDKNVIVDGQEILFRSGDQPDSLRGLSLDGFGIDEAREFKTRAIYDIMIGRLSNSINAQAFITTSPKGKNWVNQLEGQPNTETIIQKTEENPFLPDEYIISLRSQYTTDFARQELDADIVEFGIGIIMSKWFNRIGYIKPLKGVRFWDVAVSIKTSADFSSGALCSFIERFVLHHIEYGKMQYPELRKKIIECAKQDGPDITIAVEEAGQQLGFINDLQQIPELRGYTVRGVRPQGDNLNRALRWACRAQSGMMDVCTGTWNDGFFDECNSFTADDTHEHDDMIASVSGAYQCLVTDIPIWSKFSASNTKKFNINWNEGPDYTVYAAFYQNRQAEVYTIGTVWDNVEGRLYVYWHQKYDSVIPELIAMEAIKALRLRVSFNCSIVCNDIMAGEIGNRTTAQLIGDSLKKAGVSQSITEPTLYEPTGSLAYVGALFATDAILVHKSLVEPAAQFSGWTYKENGKEPHEGYEYCRCLCLIGAALKNKVERERKEYKRPDYHSVEKEKKTIARIWETA
jgi:predicted phage terminase large subunit-like protein